VRGGVKWGWEWGWWLLRPMDLISGATCLHIPVGAVGYDPCHNCNQHHNTVVLRCFAVLFSGRPLLHTNAVNCLAPRALTSPDAGGA